MIVYYAGQYLSKSAVRISPDDRGFLFADGVYEVIRSYAGKLFAPAAHFERLERSLSELKIDAEDIGKLKEVPEELIKRNDLEKGDATIYIQITRGAAKRSHAFPDESTPVTVYAFASPFQGKIEQLEQGVKVNMAPDIRWTRCDIKSISLLPNVLGAQAAVENGATETVFIRDGAITEGSHTNVFAVFRGKVHTYPKSNYILAGITRASILDLCGELKIPVVEYPIREDEFYQADEAFLAGTTVEVTPIIQADNNVIGSGLPGSVAIRLQQALQALVS